MESQVSYSTLKSPPGIVKTCSSESFDVERLMFHLLGSHLPDRYSGLAWRTRHTIQSSRRSSVAPFSRKRLTWAPREVPKAVQVHQLISDWNDLPKRLRKLLMMAHHESSAKRPGRSSTTSPKYFLDRTTASWSLCSMTM